MQNERGCFTMGFYRIPLDLVHFFFVVLHRLLAFAFDSVWVVFCGFTLDCFGLLFDLGRCLVRGFARF